MRKKISGLFAFLFLLNSICFAFPIAVSAAPGSVALAAQEYYASTGTADRHNINFSADTIVDFLHFNALSAPNKKIGVMGARLTFVGNATKSLSRGTDWNNSAISYTNGVNPASVNASPNFFLYTGLNSVGTFTAPSKNNVERTLHIYMGGWAAKEAIVTASMGTTTLTGIPVFTTVSATTRLAHYSFTYTGRAAEEPLVVSFKLTNADLSPNWACIGFSGACITEGEPEPASPAIRFTSPDLSAANAVKIPPSGYTRRDLPAALFDAQGTEVLGAEILYTLETPVAGVTLTGNMLKIASGVPSSATVQVRAASAADPSIFAIKSVELVKDGSLEDFPANPIDKEGYLLYHSSEFDENPDPRYWTDYYLRSWGTDEGTKSHYYVENGNLVLYAPRDIAPAWSAQDRNHRVSSIMTYEQQHLHRFGAASESRNIPVFDGLATKYGYFEVRLKMPNTRDGSHFAWWMVGTQDDQHPTVSLANNPNAKYPIGPGGWGKEDYYWSNQGAEYDIIEQHLDPIKAGFASYDSWLPVIHKNGTRDYTGRWYAGDTSQVPVNQRYRYSANGVDPYNEFHVYGFDWDENGTRFYIDNQLVYTSSHSAGYRMLTFLSVYAGRSVPESGDFGWDRGIFPKDAIIDYFRIYKKNEAPRPTSVVLNNYNTAHYFPVPASDSIDIQMEGVVLDQFDKEISLSSGQSLKWCFAGNIGGETDRTTSLNGVSIHPDTGVVTVQAGANMNQDIFVTAYVEGADVPAKQKVYETRHVKLETAASKPVSVEFNHKVKTVAPGAVIDVSAAVYDQYKKPMEIDVNYSFSKDITARETVTISGVSVDSEGKLRVAPEVPAGTVIIVTADSGYTSILNGAYLQAEDKVAQNLVLRVGGDVVFSKEDLQALLAKCESLSETNYTQESWQALQVVYSSAGTVYADAGATQEQVSTAVQNLQTALNNLVRQLDVLIAEYDAMENEGQYTPASWTNFQNAITTAKQTASNAEASQSALSQQSRDLVGARLALIPAANKVGLSTVVGVVENTDLSGCTQESQNAIAAALEAAHQVLADENASQQEVDSAYDALVSTFITRKDKADLTDLTALVIQVESLDAALFTPASWAGVESPLAAAIAVLEMQDPSQDDADTAYRALFDALTALVSRANFAALQQAVDKAGQIIANPGKYVPSTLVGLDVTLENAKLVLNNPNNTQTAVNEQTRLLNEAILKVRTRANLSGLTRTFNAAQDINLQSYTTASAQRLRTEMETAQRLLQDPEVSQEIVDQHVVTLQDAINVLQPKEITGGTGASGGSSPQGSSSAASSRPATSAPKSSSSITSSNIHSATSPSTSSTNAPSNSGGSVSLDNNSAVSEPGIPTSPNPVAIQETNNPTTGFRGVSWSLISLFVSIGNIILAVFGVMQLIDKKKHDEEREKPKSRLPNVLVSLIGIMGISFFALTANFAGRMVGFNKGTLFLCILLVVQIIALVFTHSKRKSNDRSEST